MATYAIGDIQGCYQEFRLLLKKIKFNPNHDQLWLAGDMVSRGPKSLEVLQYIYDNQDVCTAVLGNHDLHLLASYHLDKKLNPKDKLKSLIKSPECDALLAWLISQPIAYYDKELKTLMTHAGVPPKWDLDKTLANAFELENVLLKGSKRIKYFKSMYGNEPVAWSKNLKKQERLRFTTNALTRMRFCDKQGSLNLAEKGSPNSKNKKLKPWYKFKKQLLKETTLVFGHWAALNGEAKTKNLYALDTGCVWGNKLTALRLEDKKYFTVKAVQKWS